MYMKLCLITFIIKSNKIYYANEEDRTGCGKMRIDNMTTVKVFRSLRNHLDSGRY